MFGGEPPDEPGRRAVALFENEQDHIAGRPHLRHLWGMVMCRICEGTLTIDKLPNPLELWRRAGGNDDSIPSHVRRARYRELLEEHGMLVPRCDFISEGTKRRCTKEANHGEGHNLDNTDIFGHGR